MAFFSQTTVQGWTVNALMT